MRTLTLASRWSLLATLALASACGGERPSSEQAASNDSPFAPLEVKPGSSVGTISLGMTYPELIDAVGPPSQQLSFQRVITLRYPERGLEVLLSSSDPTKATDDARVRAVSNLPGATLSGDLTTGLKREALVTRFGNALIESRGVSYFPDAGLAVKFNEQGTAERFAVWPAYSSTPTPPEMGTATTQADRAESRPVRGGAPRYELDGEYFEVVDLHLHAGRIANQPPSGVEFLLSQLPAQALMYYPATADLVLDPYGEHLGLKQHLAAAGVAHGVILAAYTHHTVGYAENRWLESLLNDPRNINPDGSRWAWGMASINFDDFEQPAVAVSRLAALDSFFTSRRDLFIGIKLAHAHQAVSFDDPIYQGVYEVAAKHDVPVLLHTGFSPFPNTMTEPDFYDPQSLKAVVEAYDGQHGQGRVEFVLAHVGQGDARAIENSLQLAVDHDNVWLEISAINRPLQIDESGTALTDGVPVHSDVLWALKERGLVERTMFATDGPQYFGKVQSYLQLMTSTMKELGYRSDEIRAILSENFYRCFLPSP